MRKPIVVFALALGCAGGAHFALAQDKNGAQRVETEKIKPPQTAQQSAKSQKSEPQKAGELMKRENPVPPPTGRNLPEQGGKQEGSSKVAGTNPRPTVLEKGLLTAPGARKDVDTAPAKFTTRTDRDDQLPIVAYRLKHLTGDQRREILAQLGAAGSNPKAEVPGKVGAELPAGFALDALAPMPEPVTAKFRELRGTAFVRASGKAIIVDLDNRLVIGVLEG